jgi:hypothetical protein
MSPARIAWLHYASSGHAGAATAPHQDEAPAPSGAGGRLQPRAAALGGSLASRETAAPSWMQKPALSVNLPSRAERVWAGAEVRRRRRWRSRSRELTSERWALTRSKAPAGRAPQRRSQRGRRPWCSSCADAPNWITSTRTIWRSHSRRVGLSFLAAGPPRVARIALRSSGRDLRHC